jgi:hypothetical protein
MLHCLQIRKETAPWVSEIVQPLIKGRPEPLTDTVPPQQLGDPDSKWIQAVLLMHGFNGSVFSWCLTALQANARLKRLKR